MLGMLLPVTPAQHLGLRELGATDHHHGPGQCARGGPNHGRQRCWAFASWWRRSLAGADSSIDDGRSPAATCCALPEGRSGNRRRTLGCVVKAPSTLGTFLRSFRWGHVRQLDRVSRELPRAWSAGAGPGDAPFTIDLDSTMRDIRSGQGGGAPRLHGQEGLSPAVGRGRWHRRRADGPGCARAGPTPLGVPPTCLRETVGRVRYAGARGQLTVRADSGFYTHAIVAACRRMDVRFSITIRQSASLRSLIEAIPEQDWTPIPYWMEGAADVGRNQLHSLPEQARRRAGAAHRPAREAHARFPVGPLRHLQLSRLHHRPG